jgi:hypothetical protein
VQPVRTDRNHLQHPPLTVDLYYLLTPYSQNRETELIILERVMQVFHDMTTVLKGELLQRSLAESGNEEIRVNPVTLSLDDVNKLWAIFPNKSLRPSVCYILSPVKIPSMLEDRTIPFVIEKGKKLVIHEIEKKK